MDHKLSTWDIDRDRRVDVPVDKLTLRPVLKKSLKGFRSYVKNSALLLSGLIASPICLR